MPALQITSVPAYGKDGSMTGTVTGVTDYAAYRIALRISRSRARAGGPSRPPPRPPCQSARTALQANVTTGGIDNRATIYYAVLVPAGTRPPLARFERHARCPTARFRRRANATTRRCGLPASIGRSRIARGGGSGLERLFRLALERAGQPRGPSSGHRSPRGPVVVGRGVFDQAVGLRNLCHRDQGSGG